MRAIADSDREGDTRSTDLQGDWRDFYFVFEDEF